MNKTSLIFTILTTISFLLMVITIHLRQSEDEATFRKNKKILEYLTIASFLISLTSLIGNWVSFIHFIHSPQTVRIS